MSREIKPLHHGMLEGSDLINYSFKRRNSLKLCDFYWYIHYLQSYWIYREKYRFSMHILATGCYSSETNAIVHLQYVKHFSVSLSICAMFCKKPQSMFEINEWIFFVRYMNILYFCPVLLAVFLAGRIQIDSWNYAMIPVSMASKFL